MTSIRRRFANQRNAQKSTGPRTAVGKRTSSMNALTHGLSSSSSSITLDWMRILLSRDAFVASVGLDGDCVDLECAEELAFLAAEQQAIVDRAREVRRRVWASAEHCDELTERGGLEGFEPGMYPPEDKEWVQDVSKFLKGLKPYLFQSPCKTIEEERAVIADVASKELKKLTRFERRAARLRDQYLRALQLLSEEQNTIKSQNEPNT